MKIVQITYNEPEEFGFIEFKDKAADIVEDALFRAESKGALMAIFMVGDLTYYMRTDKYLYWTVGHRNDPSTPPTGNKGEVL